MTDLTKLIGKQIHIQIAGKEFVNGILIDVGTDILVLFNGKDYMYIPLFHIHQLELNSIMEEHVSMPMDTTVDVDIGPLSIKDVLTSAKGKFIEIYLTRGISFCGYINNIYHDYVTFYSPLQKLIYIPISHFKWIIPYNEENLTFPLSNDQQALSETPSFHQSLVELLKKSEGKLVKFDGGINPRKMGLLKKVENNLAELILVTGETVCLKLSHIKSVQLP